MGLITYYQLVKAKKVVGEEVDIDKSCFELAEGFDALGLDGNYLVIGSKGSDEDSEGGDDGFYEAELAATAVKKNWEKMKDVTFGQFFAAFKKTNLGKSSGDDSEEYLKAHFETLKDVYQAAAGKSAGIKISAS